MTEIKLTKRQKSLVLYCFEQGYFRHILTVEAFAAWHEGVVNNTLDEMPTPIREEYLGWKNILEIE